MRFLPLLFIPAVMFFNRTRKFLSPDSIETGPYYFLAAFFLPLDDISDLRFKPSPGPIRCTCASTSPTASRAPPSPRSSWTRWRRSSESSSTSPLQSSQNSPTSSNSQRRNSRFGFRTEGQFRCFMIIISELTDENKYTYIWYIYIYTWYDTFSHIHTNTYIYIYICIFKNIHNMKL